MGSLLNLSSLHKILIVANLGLAPQYILTLHELLPNYDYILINGRMFHNLISLSDVEQRLNFLQQHLKSRMIYVVGREEYNLLLAYPHSSLAVWIQNKCNIVVANFMSREVLITDGGILPTMQKPDLFQNLEVSFVSNMHGAYQGHLGFVVCNNPIVSTQPAPIYYNFSLQLGSENQVLAQEMDEIGLKQLYKWKIE